MSDKPVTVNIGGEDRELKYNFNAFARLEDELGKTIIELEKQMRRGSISATRALVWAGILHKFPDLALERVGEWLDEVEDYEVIGTAITEGMAAWTKRKKKSVDGTACAGAAAAQPNGK